MQVGTGFQGITRQDPQSTTIGRNILFQAHFHAEIGDLNDTLIHLFNFFTLQRHTSPLKDGIHPFKCTDYNREARHLQYEIFCLLFRK